MTSGSSQANWSGGDAYERYMGRWSRLVSVEFLDWLGMPVGSHWLDVGCGTGALSQAIVANHDPAEVTGVDTTEPFLDQARTNVQSLRAIFVSGDAQSLPLENDRYDAVVSGLVLNFIPNVVDGIAEMVRVAKSDGLVAGYVWDYGGRMEIMRRFWDVAVPLDPEAARFDEGSREPQLCRPEILSDHFQKAGLVDVEVAAVDVDAHFVDFDDYWSPFTGGQGSAPTYVMSLDSASRETLKNRLRTSLPVAADGSIDLLARAWAVRGTRPNS